MPSRAEVIALCGRLPDSYEDYPFDDPNWTAMRHRTNRKTDAFIFERQGHLWINVKAEPQWGDFWKSSYPAVVPAYHMNKRHWNQIDIYGHLSDSMLQALIRHSYSQVAKKLPRKVRQEHPEIASITV